MQPPKNAIKHFKILRQLKSPQSRSNRKNTESCAVYCQLYLTVSILMDSPAVAGPEDIEKREEASYETPLRHISYVSKKRDCGNLHHASDGIRDGR